MNTCDHGHDTPDETRVLPIGGGSNIIICRRHYIAEAAFRRDGARRYDPKDWTMPSWESLEVYPEPEPYRPTWTAAEDDPNAGVIPGC